jgi:ubiquinone/menaquinone biosynthesis C-methylase UbiE
VRAGVVGGVGAAGTVPPAVLEETVCVAATSSAGLRAVIVMAAPRYSSSAPIVCPMPRLAPVNQCGPSGEVAARLGHMPDPTSMTHQHTPDVDFAAHADDMEHSARLRSAVTAQIAAELPLPPDGDGAVVADIGCGTGDMALLLAERVRHTRGRVLAVDREAVLLDRVRQRAEAAGLAGVVHTVRADLVDLPGALPEPVQLLWAGRVVHHVGDQAAAVAALVGALAPGGVLALGESGLQPHCLPWDVGVGRPGIEDRMLAAHDEWFAAMRADLPGSVRDPRGWPAMLRAAGLVDVTARSWLLDRPAPLSAADRDAVLDRLAGWVERADRWLDPDDRASWQRLLDPEDPAWLGHRDDLFMLAAETVHFGRRE